MGKIIFIFPVTALFYVYRSALTGFVLELLIETEQTNVGL